MCLYQQLRLRIDAKAVAVAIGTARINIDNLTLATGNTTGLGFEGKTVMIDDMPGIAQKQTGETIGTRLLDKHKFFIGNKTMQGFVVAYELAGAAIKHFQAFTLARTIDQVRYPGRLHGAVILVRKHPGIICFTRGFLGFFKQRYGLFGLP